MKVTTTTKLLGLGLGAAALCASALPAAAASFTQPGATTGSAAGFNPPPGLYFANVANYGIGQELPGKFPPGDSTAVGVEVPIFIWVPGWNFLGATYSANVAFPLVEVGVKSPGHAADLYLRAPFNPAITPVDLSWSFGNGFAISFAETIYIPIQSDTTVNTSAAAVTSPAAFEQRVAISYIGNDWIASANGIFGIVTKDGAGIQQQDYVNVDLTLAHTFGKWTVGAIGYYAADINAPVGSTAAIFGKNEEFGLGGLLGYNFGPVDISFRLTHEFVTKGDSNYGIHDTRVWTSVVIPIWNPTPPAPPRPLVAKY
jgi:hypothetical protein